MEYIQSVLPLPNYCLEIKMTNGSSATVYFKPRFKSVKYMPLQDEETFKTVSTDGNDILWKNGLVKITVKEILNMILREE